MNNTSLRTDCLKISGNLFFNFSFEPSSISFQLHYLLFTIRGPNSKKPGCLDLTKNLTCFVKLARTVMSSRKGMTRNFLIEQRFGPSMPIKPRATSILTKLMFNSRFGFYRQLSSLSKEGTIANN